ncbi:hypothetical protein Tco_1218278 [Tanacetum coccineum]
MKELWEADVVSEHFDRDDNAGNDNKETKPDPEEIYNHRSLKNHSLQHAPPTSALQQSSLVLEMVKSRLLTRAKLSFSNNEYYNLPPQTVSPDPVAIVASRAVDLLAVLKKNLVLHTASICGKKPGNQESVGDLQARYIGHERLGSGPEDDKRRSKDFIIAIEKDYRSGGSFEV